MSKTVLVKIFGREEAISCEESETEDLIKAVSLLNAEMLKAKEATRQTISFEKACMLASLNLIHQHREYERRAEQISGELKAIIALSPRLNQLLRDKKNDSSKV